MNKSIAFKALMNARYEELTATPRGRKMEALRKQIDALQAEHDELEQQEFEASAEILDNLKRVQFDVECSDGRLASLNAPLLTRVQDALAAVKHYVSRAC